MKGLYLAVCKSCQKIILMPKDEFTLAKAEKRKYCSRACYSSLRIEDAAYQWKGDSVGYRALHHWVVRRLGQPDTCSNCKGSNFKAHQIHWANKSREYKRDISDWLRLCVPCHGKYDTSFRQRRSLLV